MRCVPILPVLLLAMALTPAEADNNPGKYVGSQACKVCHADVWLNFYKNPHARPAARESAVPAERSCESCHGPGGDHVAAHGGKSTIRAFSVMDSAQINQACLSCHSKDLPRAEIRNSPHTEADLACTTCHSIHRSATPKSLLTKTQKDLCYSCHPSERAQFDMPSKHRVNEGAMQCTDCHNPHGAPAGTIRTGLSSAMLKPAFDNEEPCLKCHVDKRGPFVFEHAGVRVEGCEACHTPHGSMNAKLLRRPVVFTLCLECHNGAGTFGREKIGVFLTNSTHNLLDPKYRHCTLCHVRIHGSNADPTFLR